MKSWAIASIALLLTGSSTIFSRTLVECDDAVSAAADAYSYARRAYRLLEFDEAIGYARKAMNAALDAEGAASDCECEEVESGAQEAYSYARKAYRESNLADV